MSKLKVVDLMNSDDDFFYSVYDGHIDHSKFDVVRSGKDPTEDLICDLVEDADILLTDSFHKVKVTRRIIESAKKLKLIQCHTVGFNDVDIDAARERRIPVANSAGITAKPMAEYTILAALYLLKPVRYAHDQLSNGRWVQGEVVSKAHLLPLEFGEQTLGILGCGSIGQEIARLAKGFGTRIIYHNRSRLLLEIEQSLNLEYVSFDELIRRSDVLSVNVPLTEETVGMIGVEEISNMKPGSILINTARGGVVDEKALADALREGHLKGAAIDVFVEEPLSEDSPLLGLENVLLTPHMSAISPQVLKRVPVKVVENLNRIYEGKPPLRIVG